MSTRVATRSISGGYVTGVHEVVPHQSLLPHFLPIRANARGCPHKGSTQKYCTEQVVSVGDGAGKAKTIAEGGRPSCRVQRVRYSYGVHDPFGALDRFH